MRQQDAEVVTGKPRQYATSRQVLIEQSGESHDDLVTGPAPEGIVDELQIIEIKINNLVRVVFCFQAFPRFVHLGLESRPIHQPCHRVERLFDDILDLAHDMRHETPMRCIEGFLAYATEQRQHALYIALLIRDRAEQGLVALVSGRFAALECRDLEHDG